MLLSKFIPTRKRYVIAFQNYQQIILKRHLECVKVHFCILNSAQFAQNLTPCFLSDIVDFQSKDFRSNLRILSK